MSLESAARNVSDRRTSMDEGFWVSQKEMRALDEALAARPKFTASCQPTEHRFEAIITRLGLNPGAVEEEGACLYCRKCGQVRPLDLRRPR